MDYRITFAQPEAEAELRGILLESDMDLAGAIQEHVLIQSGERTIGGALLTQTGADQFHLAVFAVTESERGQGIGRRLLRELIQRPWEHSLNGTGAPPSGYTVTTVAKGKSSLFYRKNGFSPCDFALLAQPYRGQCGDCPEREECGPVAMSYQERGGLPEVAGG